ncbi:hypothetical protein PQX77_005892 [Marasmius sp. AFHP31]|nr:hypothetical protein PQX77_005892 [Marasmius sp. AFHP31]
MSRRPLKPSKNLASTSNRSCTPIKSEPKDTFRVPDLPSRVQPCAASSSTLLSEVDNGEWMTSDFPTEPDLLAFSSQPVEDHIGWLSSQIPSLQALRDEAQSVKRHRVKSTVFQEPPPAVPTSNIVPPTNHRLPRARPPLADCDKLRHHNNGLRSSTSEPNVAGASSSSLSADDKFYSNFTDIMKKASKDVDIKQKSLKSVKLVGKAANGKGKGKTKTDRRKTWSGCGVVDGRIEKRGLYATLGSTTVAAGGCSGRSTGKGKSVERSPAAGPEEDGDRMDVDADRTGVSMDVDLPPPPLPYPSPPPRPEKPKTPPVLARHITLPARDSRFEPPVASGSSDGRRSSRVARDQAIKRALSSGLDEASRAKSGRSSDASSPTVSSSSSMPSPSTFFAGSSSPLATSASCSSGNGSMKRTSSLKSDYDSVYGSLPVQGPLVHNSQGPSKKEKETVRTPSPFVVPGLNNLRKASERESMEPKPQPPRAAIYEQPQPLPQEVKRSGPPMLGMMRRHNLASSSNLSQGPKGFKAPFRRTESGGTRQENIAKALEERSALKRDAQDDSDGPDIHEGNADSSNYSALDISMDSDMADELNRIEDRLTQEMRK